MSVSPPISWTDLGMNWSGLLAQQLTDTDWRYFSAIVESIKEKMLALSGPPYLGNYPSSKPNTELLPLDGNIIDWINWIDNEVDRLPDYGVWINLETEEMHNGSDTILWNNAPVEPLTIESALINAGYPGGEADWIDLDASALDNQDYTNMGAWLLQRKKILDTFMWTWPVQGAISRETRRKTDSVYDSFDSWSDCASQYSSDDYLYGFGGEYHYFGFHECAGFSHPDDDRWLLTTFVEEGHIITATPGVNRTDVGYSFIGTYNENILGAVKENSFLFVHEKTSPSASEYTFPWWPNAPVGLDPAPAHPVQGVNFQYFNGTNVVVSKFDVTGGFKFKG